MWREHIEDCGILCHIPVEWSRDPVKQQTKLTVLGVRIRTVFNYHVMVHNGSAVWKDVGGGSYDWDIVFVRKESGPDPVRDDPHKERWESVS